MTALPDSFDLAGRVAVITGGAVYWATSMALRSRAQAEFLY